MRLFFEKMVTFWHFFGCFLAVFMHFTAFPGPKTRFRRLACPPSTVWCPSREAESSSLNRQSEIGNLLWLFLVRLGNLEGIFAGLLGGVKRLVAPAGNIIRRVI